MKKFLKVLLVFVILLAGAVLGIGFSQAPTMAARTEVVVNASQDDVWELVSDPRRTGEWLPKEVAEIERVEMLSGGKVQRAAGKVLDMLAGETTPSGKNVPTHRYHLAGGKFLDMQIVEERGRRYLERVVGGNSGVEGFFESMQWGFEVREGDKKGTTLLTIIQEGVSKRPLGTFLKSIMVWAGKPASNARRMAANIEKIAASEKK